MSPTTARGKSGRTYRYYVSASLQQGARISSDETMVQRLAARDIETVVAQAVRRWKPLVSNVFDTIGSVRLARDGLHLELTGPGPAEIVARLSEGEQLVDRGKSSVTILLPLALPLRGGRRRIEASHHRAASPDLYLIAALRHAHRMLDRERGSPIMQAAPRSPYDRSLLRLAFLAPDIQQAIFQGTQPGSLNLEALKKMTIPLAWTRQRKVLRFDATSNACSYD